MFAILTVLAVTSPSVAQDDGWQTLFDGKSLEKWDGNPDFWRVEDGTITGQTTPENPTKGNTFIIWRGGEVGEFELKLEYRIVGGNSGIQYRSFEVPDAKWVVGGYQADFEAGETYSGILYGERFRGILANRGLKTELVRNDGKFEVKTVEKLGDSAEIQKQIKKEDWNEYHVTANDFHFTHRINGVVTSECTDNDKDERRATGILALQLHAGPPMKVQFRNIRIRPLGEKKTAAVSTAAPTLAGQANVQDSAQKRVAFVAGVRSHGYGSHEHKAGCILLAKKLEAAMPNVKTVVHTNGWPQNEEALDGFDCIVMYSDGGGGHMVNPHLAQVDRYTKQGVGIVCLHYAVEVPIGPSGDAFLNWIGGYFESDWSVNPHWTGHFNDLPKHPITNGVKPFSTNDEWYYHMRFRPELQGVTPILTDLPPRETLVKADGSLARPDNAHNNNPHVRAAVLERKERQHVAWAMQRADGGRGFGFTGGHNHWNWGNPDQLKLVLNAVVWCARAEVPSGGVPAPEVTLDDLKANQDYEPAENFDFGGIQKMLDDWNGRKTLALVPAGAAELKKNETDRPAGALFQSPVISGTTAGHSVDINVDLKGAKSVFLVVRDGGDGFGCDWADWVDPRFTGPAGEKSLTELKWKSASAGFGSVNVNRNAGGNAATVAGKPVDRCLGTHAISVIEFDVPEGYTHFAARGALDGGGTNQGCGSTVTFAVYTQRPSDVPVEAPGSGSHDLADALAQLDVVEGLEATLFAAEPSILNPTSIDIDHLGRVWVCEVLNYRRFANNQHPERTDGDRILVLQDANGDGVQEVQVFYQGRDADSAHGICVLPTPDGKGTRVIVSANDSVFSLIDENGDLKADRKELLFTGIGGTQHDHGIHAFAFGPDGRLYFNFGNSGQRLKDRDGNPVVDLSQTEINDSRKPYQEGMVFRCDPDGSNVETLGWNFRNNWEVCVDSFGTLWQSDNDDDGNRGVRINFVMEFGNYGYKDELTGAGWREPRTNMEDEIPLRHWHLNDPGVVPNLVQTGAGAPTGICLYEGSLLPETFRNQIIHCDAGPNIVRAYPAKSDGAGYSAYMQPILHGARDNWFRPSDVCVAPDGSLIIADWYDPGVGGHRMGDVDRGRLFRVAPPGVKYSVPKIDVSTVAGAVEALGSPNLAARYLAWMSLHGAGSKAEDALQKVFQTSSDPRLQARALWLLGQIPGRGEHYVGLAIQHQNADLRITGLRLARRLKLDVIPVVRSLVGDSSSAVRRECAIALRLDHSSDKARLWADLAAQHDGHDRWYLEAIGIGAGTDWDACLAVFMEHQPRPNARALADVVWRSRSSRTPELLSRLIASTDTPGSEIPRYLRAFDFQTGPGKDAALFELAFGYHGHGDKARAELVNLEAINRLDAARIRSRDGAVEALNRLLDSLQGTSQFVQLATRFEMSDRYPVVLELAVANPESQLGVDAVTALLSRQQGKLISEVLNGDNAERALATARVLLVSGDGRAVGLLMPIIQDEDKPAELRRVSAQAVASSRNGAARLIELAQKGELDPALAPAVASRLHASNQQDIRQQAEKLFPLPPSKNATPLPPISELAKRRGDIAHGKLIFETTGTCAKCHVVNGQGKEVGPNLSEIGNKLSREAFFESILFPSAGISHNFEGYSVILNDGNVVNGVLTSRTAEAVTIKTAEAIVRVIPVSEIDEVVKQKISLMPADIQKLMTEQDLVDVVEYLSTLKKAQPATAAAGSGAERPFEKRINVNFQRTPLYQAIEDVGREAGVVIRLDAEALKLSGYTRNMPQTLNMVNTSTADVLAAVVRQYPMMVVAADSSGVVVTTRPVADRHQWQVIVASR